MLRTGGGDAHRCKTARLMVILLLCAVPAAVQLHRHAGRQAAAAPGHPQRSVYELLGDVARPGIYRYANEQTLDTLAAACGAAHRQHAHGAEKVPAGTRLAFAGSLHGSSSMDAAALISYGLPLSLQAATARDLEHIPGIGPKTARALIAYRDRAGPIEHMDQLLAVRGIGPRTLEKLTRYLRP